MTHGTTILIATSIGGAITGQKGCGENNFGPMPHMGPSAPRTRYPPKVLTFLGGNSLTCTENIPAGPVIKPV